MSLPQPWAPHALAPCPRCPLWLWHNWGPPHRCGALRGWKWCYQWWRLGPFDRKTHRKRLIFLTMKNGICSTKKCWLCSEIRFFFLRRSKMRMRYLPKWDLPKLDMSSPYWSWGAMSCHPVDFFSG
jgi:hypothetical protein